MIAARFVTVSALLAMIILTACGQEPPNSALPATVRPVATASPVVPAPTPKPTTVHTSTATPAPTASPTAAAEPTRAPTIAPPGLLRLADNLDDPQGYCVDVAGFGSNLRLDAPLQAHTCKPGADDQLLEPNAPTGRDGFRLVRHDRCLAASAIAPGATLEVAGCEADSGHQRFILDHDGRVYLTSLNLPKLCVGVAPGAGEPAGGRNHLRRDLALHDCNDTDPALITWELVNP